MTAMPPHSQHAEALHAARSRVIDAFGQAELEIVALLRDVDAKILKAPLSQKIAVVRKIEPSPHYSKKRRAAVLESLDELTLLLQCRAEIAHSAMQVVRVRGDGEDRAGFCNPALQPEHGRRMALYSELELARLAEDVRAIAGRLAA
jgi:hypothetical protein